MHKKLGKLYVLLLEYLHNYCNGEVENVLDRQSVCYILSCMFHVPKEKHGLLIKELERNGYIEQVNRGRGHLLYRVLK